MSTSLKKDYLKFSSISLRRIVNNIILLFPKAQLTYDDLTVYCYKYEDDCVFRHQNNASKTVTVGCKSIEEFYSKFEKEDETSSVFGLKVDEIRVRVDSYSSTNLSAVEVDCDDELSAKKIIDIFNQEGQPYKNKAKSILLERKVFISEVRIKELKSITATKFDFSRLIALCEELNSNWNLGNVFSSGLLVRTIMNHIPPIFGHTTFEQVAANYAGGKSFKESMGGLLNFHKNLADDFAHQVIRKKEPLPSLQSIEPPKAALDMLLIEILRIAH